MHIPGHLSAALLAALTWRARPLPRPWRRDVLLPALLGGVLPDLIDKPILWLGWSVHGRTVGHSVLTWSLVCLLAAWAQERRAAGRWWLTWVAAGMGTHYLADLAEALLLGALHARHLATSWWLWPLMSPDTWNYPPGHGHDPLFPDAHYWIALEALTVLVATALTARSARAAS